MEKKHYVIRKKKSPEQKLNELIRMATLEYVVRNKKERLSLKYEVTRKGISIF